MIEKHGDSEIKVWKENGKLYMQLPGGSDIQHYDGRYGNLDDLEEGIDKIFPILKD